jgi:hypothetical protein
MTSITDAAEQFLGAGQYLRGPDAERTEAHPPPNLIPLHAGRIQVAG